MVNPTSGSANDAYIKRMDNPVNTVAPVNTENYDAREISSREAAQVSDNAATSRAATADTAKFSKEAITLNTATGDSPPTAPPPQPVQETQKLIIDIIA